MSTRRSKPGASYTRLKRDQDGHALCRWCSKQVPKGRRTFCGPACVDEWNLRVDPNYARRMVEERDRGVCAVCGIDTERLKRISQRLRKLAVGYCDWPQDEAPWVVFPSAARRLQDLEILCALVNLYMGHWVSENSVWCQGALRVPCLRKHLWEADHIVPVIEGGGECGLDNLRTVCLHCHKAVTRDLAARRAARRRKQIELLP